MLYIDDFIRRPKFFLSFLLFARPITFRMVAENENGKITKKKRSTENMVKFVTIENITRLYVHHLVQTLFRPVKFPWFLVVSSSSLSLCAYRVHSVHFGK